MPDEAETRRVCDDAVGRDDATTLELLLRADRIDENARHRLFESAVSQGKPSAARLLSSWGANIDARDEYGRTALHVACSRNDVATAVRLMERGADVNATGGNGHTPLHYTAWSSNAGLAELVISHGARPDESNDGGFTPLLIAARMGSGEVFDALIEHGADPYVATSWGCSLANLEPYDFLRFPVDHLCTLS